MRVMTVVVLFLTMAGGALAQEALLDPAAQCQELGGTWSNFKGRCDRTGKHFLKDKKALAGLAIIAGVEVVRGAVTSHYRSGGTKLFGNTTTNGEIIGTEIATFGILVGLHRLEWYLGHDDPNKYWRATSYAMIPAVALGAGGYGIHDIYSSNQPLPKPQLLNNPMYQRK